MGILEIERYKIEIHDRLQKVRTNSFGFQSVSSQGGSSRPFLFVDPFPPDFRLLQRLI